MGVFIMQHSLLTSYGVYINDIVSHAIHSGELVPYYISVLIPTIVQYISIMSEVDPIIVRYIIELNVQTIFNERRAEIARSVYKVLNKYIIK